MTRFLQLLPHIIEFVIFGLSVGALGYTSGKQEWGLFTVFVFLSLLFLALLKYLESAPIAKKLARLKKREHILTTRFGDWGITDMFNMQDSQEIHRRNIANSEMIESGQVFSLLAETGASYIDPSVRRHWDRLRDKLESGYHLRLLMLNPFCTAKTTRNRRNETTSSLDPKLNLEALFSVAHKYDNIELRFTESPYCSLFITENGLMYDPYHLGKKRDRIENYFICFQIEANGSLYDILSDHFNFLWDQAMLSTNWVNDNKTKLPPELIESGLLE